MEDKTMTCKTCNKEFSNSYCMCCANRYIICDCSTNVCIECRELLYTDPAKHRFAIAWFALMDCADHMNDNNLTEESEQARVQLKYYAKRFSEV